MFKAKSKARICIESKPSNNTQIGIDTPHWDGYFSSKSGMDGPGEGGRDISRIHP